MRAWAATFVTAVAVTGCNYGASEFHCDTDGQCGAGGRCELNNVCSFSDPTCPPPSNRRYGALGGGSSGTCVGDTGSSGPDSGGNTDASIPADASPDSPPDARVCFGVLYPICLAAAPSLPLAITKDTAINTDSTDPVVCAPTMPGGGGDHYCVVVGTTIDVSGAIRATGSKPLVLLATMSITTSKAIDVGSHQNGLDLDDVGAGADPAICTTAAGTGPTAGGGGAGGSFAGSGGNGAKSTNTNSTGGTPGATATATEVRGGCRGQMGDGSNPGAGGHGGGAVYLVAGESITLAGAITAGGEGGRPGTSNFSGAGGGGAGGMIALDAPTVTVMNNMLLIANGGGGGEGSGRTGSGDPGVDATRATAAKGGSNPGLANGGDGGDGSATDEKGPGKMGSPGVTVQTVGGGGGAGGGGAGLIRAPTGSSLGNQVSPKASI